MNSKIKNLIMSATALALCCAIVLITNYSLSKNTGTAQVQQETVSALTVSTTENSDSTGSSDGKEEVIYIGMDASGAVTDINVVNIFNGGGDITDYGDYTSVKMMTTNDEITLSGDTVTFSTTSERVYYQGTLDADTALPWVISIKYYMDGTEYTADEIAGMSGSLKIELSITENEAYEGECDFAGTYLLQASFTLDTASAENIEAEGATIANVCSDKQLSYMVLPTQELNAEITADVTDFEMPSVEINGVPLSLALDLDSDELEEKIDEMLSGIEELNDGASEVNDGASELSDGADTLASGTDSLLSGAESLDSGIDAFSDGIVSLQQYLTYAKFKATMAENGLDLDELTEGNTQVIEAIEQLLPLITQVEALLSSNQTAAAYASSLGIDVNELSTLANTLITLLEGNNAAIAAMEAYLDSVSEAADTLADGADELSEGSSALVSGISSLASGTEELSDGASELSDGTAALSDGTQELSDEVNDAYDEAEEELSGLLDAIAGESEIYSFVSEKNTDVSSVQFVITTEAIEIEAEEAAEEEAEEELTLWERIKALFAN